MKNAHARTQSRFPTQQLKEHRDQIQAVRAVIEKQFVSNERLDDMDIMSIAYQHGLACVQVMF